jgi:hypothetical protein
MSGKKITIPPKVGRPEPSQDVGDQWVKAGREEPRPVPEDQEPMQRLALDLPKRLHRAIKVQASKEGTTMAKLLRQLLEQHFPTDPEERRKQAEKVFDTESELIAEFERMMANESDPQKRELIRGHLSIAIQRQEEARQEIEAT